MAAKSKASRASNGSIDPQQEEETWRKDAAHLSYEEALQAADLLLSHLQNDTLPLSELERAHRRGKIYLEHCQTLLAQVEQSVQELDPETMMPQTHDKKEADASP